MLKIVGRALFLACSWTWCIGMWLPVYLTRDWGWHGWAVFLVCNALGAMLVGLTLSAAASRQRVADNLGVMRLFSVVTILFHSAWLFMILPHLSAHSAIRQGYLGGIGAALLLISAFFLARTPGKWWPLFALFTTAATIAAWILSTRTGHTLQLPPNSGVQPPLALLFATPTILLGFACCPHLDLTFHRVRQELPGPAGAAAFVLAFGVAFPAFMLYSLLYAGGLIDRGSWSLYLLIHLTCQSVFTVAAHLRELMPGGLASYGPRWPTRRTQLLLAMLATSACVMIPFALPAVFFRRAYECMIAPYALVFPIAVILAAQGGPWTRRRWITWIALTIAALPFIALGYLGQQHELLLASTAITLIAALIPTPRRAPAPRPA
ncbi:MAG: hypothetical protein SFZ24_05275 [Planctomycetota bacterium]|nr:hypothetical protein [Planctomycetota bacterium]